MNDTGSRAAVFLWPLLTVTLQRFALFGAAAVILQYLLKHSFYGIEWTINAAAILALFALNLSFVFVPGWTWGLPILTHCSGTDAVALTFDDGPDVNITPRILDSLAAHNARATFFVLGECVDAHPELLQRIVNEGHSVGIHGSKHVQLATATSRTVERHIAETVAAIDRAVPGYRPVFMRPPYGFKSLTLLRTARRAKLKIVMWTADSWDYLPGSAQAIAKRVRRRAHPGAIVLLHDGRGRGRTADALPLILKDLDVRGLRSVALVLGD